MFLLDRLVILFMFTSGSLHGSFSGYRALWHTNHFVIENNVYDLYAFANGTAIPPLGVGTVVIPTRANIYRFPQMLVRDNIFRRLNNAPEELAPVPGVSPALRVDSVDKAIVDGNVVGLSNPNSIHYLHSNPIQAFNNLTPSGAIIDASEDADAFVTKTGLVFHAGGAPAVRG